MKFCIQDVLYMVGCLTLLYDTYFSSIDRKWISFLQVLSCSPRLVLLVFVVLLVHGHFADNAPSDLPFTKLPSGIFYGKRSYRRSSRSIAKAAGGSFARFADVHEPQMVLRPGSHGGI